MTVQATSKHDSMACTLITKFYSSVDTCYKCLWQLVFQKLANTCRHSLASYVNFFILNVKHCTFESLSLFSNNILVSQVSLKGRSYFVLWNQTPQRKISFVNEHCSIKYQQNLSKCNCIVIPYIEIACRAFTYYNDLQFKTECLYICALKMWSECQVFIQ